MPITFWIRSHYPWVRSSWVCSRPLQIFSPVCALHLTKSPCIIQFVYQSTLLEIHVIRLPTNTSCADVVVSWGSLSKVATFTAEFQMHYAVYSLLQFLLDGYTWKQYSQLTRAKNLSDWNNGQMASRDSAKSLTSILKPIPLWVCHWKLPAGLIPWASNRCS